LSGMNIDRTIAEIEYLERMFAAPDTRPLSLSDLAITFHIPESARGAHLTMSLALSHGSPSEAAAG